MAMASTSCATSFSAASKASALAHRDHHVTMAVDALGDADGALGRHQRLVVAMGVEMQAVFERVAEVALDAAPHAVEVFHAAVDDEADAHALALHHAVQHGGAGIDRGHELGIDLVDVAVPQLERVDR